MAIFSMRKIPIMPVGDFYGREKFLLAYFISVVGKLFSAGAQNAAPIGRLEPNCAARSAARKFLGAAPLRTPEPHFWDIWKSQFFSEKFCWINPLHKFTVILSNFIQQEFTET